MNKWVVGAVIILLVLLFFSTRKSFYSGDKPVVYGSMGCGYTVKLRDKIGPHEFVDCTKQTCPEFVEAYPTTRYPDGSIKVGA